MFPTILGIFARRKGSCGSAAQTMSGMMSISGWPEGGPMVPGEKGNTAAEDVSSCAAAAASKRSTATWTSNWRP